MISLVKADRQGGYLYRFLKDLGTFDSDFIWRPMQNSELTSLSSSFLLNFRVYGSAELP